MSSPPKLILSPKAAETTPTDPQALLAGLTQLGFVGPLFEYEHEQHYEAGERFLELLTFLGCSPVIGLEPQDDDDKFCHIHIVGPADKVLFRHASGDIGPRCPKCRMPVHGWPELIQQWQDDRLCRLWECPECGTETDLYRMNWRQAAGFGRFFIEVWGVFPHEAVPTEPLLSALAQSTGGRDWSFFYV